MLAKPCFLLIPPSTFVEINPGRIDRDRWVGGGLLAPGVAETVATIYERIPGRLLVHLACGLLNDWLNSPGSSRMTAMLWYCLL